MIRRGWAHESLMAMDERDFVFWRDAQLDYDSEMAEAQKEAIENARRKG